MKIELNGTWKLLWQDERGSHEIDAQVPGNVIGDLYRNRVIPDPYFGCNSHALRKYEFIDWEYKTVFREPELASRQTLRIVFDGIDTVADIAVNGTPVGHAENMFISHSFDLDPALLHDENELTVKIRSPINHARTLPPLPPSCRTLPYNYEGLRIRRPMHTYGWDIAPRLVGAGIWRNVSLEILGPERWGDLYLATSFLGRNSAELALSWNFISDAPTLEGYEAKLTLVCGESTHTEVFPLRFTAGNHVFHVGQPRLWWPAGSGEQNLYDVSLELLHDGKTVDTRTWKTGIRTIELIRDEVLDPSGKGDFFFRVNGRKIFITGSNWVPADALHGENPERTVRNLELFEEVGCNMVRCWGGNIYEDDTFFDWCDEHGLLVWQDFMFACETGPQDEAFLEAVREEARSVITALRNHPSLALWCGDNECDELFFCPQLNKRHVPSENRISREVLPRMVYQFDPVRDYLPSSPFLHDDLKRNGQRYRSPEQHLWGPRDTWKGNFYKNNSAVFASEIGYHGMTDVSSIRRFIPEAELNDRHGASWTCHAAQPFGDLNGPYSYRNRLMEEQTRGFFGLLPEQLTRFMICSQIVQAEAMKYFIELFRARKWSKSGLIWWNVIDCWPQFSDAVTDYYYVRKLAFYYIRNAQQKLLLIIGDPEAWNCRLTADNARGTTAEGTYRVTDLLTGELFSEGEFSVAADSAEEIASFPVCQGEQRMLLIEWECGGRKYCNHYLLGDPPVRPELYLQWLEKLDRLIYRPLGRHEWSAGDY